MPGRRPRSSAWSDTPPRRNRYLPRRPSGDRTAVGAAVAYCGVSTARESPGCLSRQQACFSLSTSEHTSGCVHSPTAVLPSRSHPQHATFAVEWEGALTLRRRFWDNAPVVTSLIPMPGWMTGALVVLCLAAAFASLAISVCTASYGRPPAPGCFLATTMWRLAMPAARRRASSGRGSTIAPILAMWAPGCRPMPRTGHGMPARL